MLGIRETEDFMLEISFPYGAVLGEKTASRL
jgi:hypothetical protein